MFTPKKYFRSKTGKASITIDFWIFKLGAVEKTTIEFDEPEFDKPEMQKRTRNSLF